MPERLKILQEERDTELRAELEKIDGRRYIEYGTIKIQIRNGMKTLTTIERTYPD